MKSNGDRINNKSEIYLNLKYSDISGDKFIVVANPSRYASF
jgi:hypothetical protein